MPRTLQHFSTSAHPQPPLLFWFLALQLYTTPPTNSIDFPHRAPPSAKGPSLIDDLPDHEPNIKSGAGRQPLVALSGHWTPL
jgi:hypothetical protein